MSPAYAIVRDLRRRSALSQRALAERAGVSSSTVARIERGRMEPTLALLQRLAEAADCELRIRIAEIDWAGRDALDEMSFEERLNELKRFSELELELSRR